MSSESSDWITVSSRKDPQNNQMDLIISGTKYKDTDVAGPPRDNISHSADPCNSVQVSVRKRRAGEHEEMPQKRMRCSSLINSTEHRKVSVEDIRVQRGKRKASVDATPPKKKSRCSVNATTDPNAGSVIDCQLGSGKRKADHDGEAPKKRVRCSLTESRAPVSTDKVEEDKSAADDGDDVSQEEKIYALSSSGNTSRADFVHKYKQLNRIGAGGFGSVYGGLRRADLLPVAIKHIDINNVLREQVTCNGKVYNVIVEVACMLKTAGLPGSAGPSAAVSLLDWYILDQGLILVMERPEQSQDLYSYCKAHGGSLDEHEAKIILKQLVDAAIDMHSKGVFHRDIKLQNVLVQGNSDEPRVRIIDFGCGTFSTDKPCSSFCGTFQYVPPEWFQCRKYWAHPSTVWQLGVLFYSLLSGHGHFTTKAFIENQIQFSGTLSKKAKTLLYMCLTRDPSRRATLEELQLSLAPRKHSPSIYPRSPLPVRQTGAHLTSVCCVPCWLHPLTRAMETVSNNCEED